MKAKHFVTLFFIVGLVFAIIGFVGPAMSQDELSSAGTADDTGLPAIATPSGEDLSAQEDIAPNAALPTTYLRVTGSVFKPRRSDVDWANSGQGGSVYASAGNTSTWWNTPVYLPQGTVIRYVRMYYYDNSASNCWGYFTVYDLDGDIVQEWGVSSSGTPGDSWDDTANINHTIDYSSYSYVLNWQPNHIGSTIMLNGFRIFFYPSGTRYGSSLILSDIP